MPLPEVGKLCQAQDPDIVAAILALAIELPGGVALQPKLPPGQIPNAGDAVSALLEQLGPALTPLAPFFQLLDLVLALVDCVKAIPDALGPPPDPLVMAECIEKLAKAAGFVAKLVPQLSIPIMIKSIIDALIVALLGVKEQLANIVLVRLDIDLKLEIAQTLAADPDLAFGSMRLIAAVDCCSASLDVQQDATAQGLCPINGLLKLLSLFMSLAGLPEIKPLEISPDLEPLLDAIDALIKLLQDLKKAIPAIPSVQGC